MTGRSLMRHRSFHERPHFSRAEGRPVRGCSDVNQPRSGGLGSGPLDASGPPRAAAVPQRRTPGSDGDRTSGTSGSAAPQPLPGEPGAHGGDGACARPAGRRSTRVRVSSRERGSAVASRCDSATEPNQLPSAGDAGEHRGRCETDRAGPAAHASSVPAGQRVSRGLGLPRFCDAASAGCGERPGQRSRAGSLVASGSRACQGGRWTIRWIGVERTWLRFRRGRWCPASC